MVIMSQCLLRYLTLFIQLENCQVGTLMVWHRCCTKTCLENQSSRELFPEGAK